MPPNITSRHELISTDIPATPVKGVTSRFLKYPSKRDRMSDKKASTWLQGFRDDSNVWPYWRIHNSIYDLSSYINKHPGGKFWLEETQGCDVTELFESSHLSDKPAKILTKYFIRNTSSARNSPFTFEETEFYKCLKRKVVPILKETSTNPTPYIYSIQDGAFALFLALLVSSAIMKSYMVMVITGAVLAASISISHNFSHSKDSWRIYIMDFSMLSSRDWRITHIFSHHVFPNTIYDFEVSAFEPFLELHPKTSKNFWMRFAPWIYFIVVFAVLMPVQYGKTWLSVILGNAKFRMELLIPPAELILVIVCAGSSMEGLWLFVVLHLSCSFWFVGVSMISSHHHLDNFSDGDHGVETRDWGIHQLISTMSKKSEGSLLWASIAFGNHPLHHLFPAVDLSRLPALLPVLKETCDEFGFVYEGRDQADLFKGLFNRMAENTPNPYSPKSSRYLKI